MQPLVVAIIGLLFAAITIRSVSVPGRMLGLVFCAFGVEQLLRANSAFFAANSSFWNVVVALAVGGVLVANWGAGRYRFRGALQPAQTSVLLFVVVYCFSTEWSPVGNVQGIVTNFGPYLLVYVLAAPLLLQTPDDGLSGLRYAGLLAVGVCAYLLLDRSIWDQDGSRLALRVLGGKGPAAVSSPLAIGDVGALAFVITGLSPGLGDWRRLKTWVRYPILALALYIVARSGRGEALASVVSLAVVSLVPHRTSSSNPLTLSRSIGSALVGLGILGMVALVLNQVMASSSGIRYSDRNLLQDLDGRVDAVAIMWRIFSNQPDSWLLGLGADYSRYAIGAYPHNQAIQALTESGVVGFSFWCIAPLLAIWGFVRVWHLVQDEPELRFAAEAYLGILVYFLVVGTKRGHVLDAVTMMSIVLLERFCLSVRAAALEAAEAVPIAEPLPRINVFQSAKVRGS